jgi:hypothetical protein
MRGHFYGTYGSLIFGFFVIIYSPLRTSQTYYYFINMVKL